MAMSDLQVFQEYAYSERREALQLNIALFNESTRGGLILRGGNHMGDFTEEAFWGNVAGIIRRRSPYATGALSELNIGQLLHKSVKVGTGTVPIRLDSAWMRWIGKSPEEAGVQFGKNLAEQTLQDMVNTAVTALIAATLNTNKMVADQSAVGDGSMNWTQLSPGMQKYGDQADKLACWVMHSTPYFQLFNNNLANANRLFSFGGVVVNTDPMGRPFVITDLPALIQAGTPNKYATIGLVPGAVLIEENPDFDQNMQSVNGDENIKRTYQAEWSYNVAMRSYSWDIVNGGKAPSNAALATGTNWDQDSQYDKNLPACIVLTK